MDLLKTRYICSLLCLGQALFLLHLCVLFTWRLLQQVDIQPKLIKALKKIYGRHHGLIHPKNKPVIHIVEETFSCVSSDNVYLSHRMWLKEFSSFTTSNWLRQECLPSPLNHLLSMLNPVTFYVSLFLHCLVLAPVFFGLIGYACDN